jgi:hypothetical protein
MLIIVEMKMAYWTFTFLNNSYIALVDMIITTPIIRKLAPNDVIPPIPNSNAWASKLMKDTKQALSGPIRNTSNGIVKKCIGKPNGDGIDKEEIIVVKTAYIAI